MCLAAGATPDHISYGNTIKRVADIAWAHGAGITLFAADAEEELEKIAEHAPGAQVYIRVIVEVSMADWPLTRKFGCDRDTALRLLDTAKALGLDARRLLVPRRLARPARPRCGRPTLDAVAALWADAKAAGHDLTLLNIGGGFPAFYGEEIQAPDRLRRGRHGRW